MKMSKKRTRKIDRKRLVNKNRNAVEQQNKDALLFEKLVIEKNEYYDQLTTEDAVLSALEKFDLPDGK
jgi:hypothetical protein